MYANEKTFKTLLELGAVASFRLFKIGYMVASLYELFFPPNCE